MTSPCEDNPFESLGLIHPHKFVWAPMKEPIQMYAPTNIESSLSQKYPQHLLGPQPKQVTAGFFGLDKKKICQLHDVSYIWHFFLIYNLPQPKRYKYFDLDIKKIGQLHDVSFNGYSF